MTDDDANDGDGEDECESGHLWWPHLPGWKFRGIRLEREYHCPHCGAITIMNGDEHPD